MNHIPQYFYWDSRLKDLACPEGLTFGSGCYKEDCPVRIPCAEAWALHCETATSCRKCTLGILCLQQQEKEKDIFKHIPPEIAKDETLSVLAKRLSGLIKTTNMKEKPKDKVLANLLGTKKKHIKKALKELQKANYMHITIHRDGEDKKIKSIKIS